MSRKSVLVIGNTGAGKSTSMINLPPKETFIINTDDKMLPFPGASKMYHTVKKDNGKIDPEKSNMVVLKQPKQVTSMINYVHKNRPKIKNLVLDTVTMAMLYDYMGVIHVSGWDKYGDLAANAWDMFNAALNVREDLTVFVLAHSDQEIVGGEVFTEFKVPGGKLLKEKANPLAMFSIVLESRVIRRGEGLPEYKFMTQNDGTNCAKSPMGMFVDEEGKPKMYIDNDLQQVKEAILNY